MTKSCTFFFLALLLGATPLVHATSGNQYRAFSEVQRQMWAVGVLDGLMMGELAASNKAPAWGVCMAKLEREQIRAIFEKALEKEPEVWHFPAAMMFHRTFQKYCKSD
jgi:hypothetical protein